MVTEKPCDRAIAPTAEEVVHLALDIGEQILICGGEISRVEDTLTRICRAYGSVRTDVFAITSLIIITADLPGGAGITQSRRIYSAGRNMRRLEALNSLSRRICSERMPTDEAHAAFDEILARQEKTAWRLIVGSLIVAFSFTLFFGGDLWDALAAIAVGAVIAGGQLLVSRIPITRILYYLICAFLAGTAAILSVKAGLGNSVDFIMTGCIMLLIPGISLTGAVENLLTGDTLSGLLGFFEALTVALSLAAGFAISWLMLGGVGV